MVARSSEDDDYYRILGVTRDVSEEGLKRAYKRQALRWHPDKNQHRSTQAAERFKKVSEAYQALSDKRTRAAYNRRRPSAGSNEVLFSKTYGWPGVNISFYWTGPPPKQSEAEQPSQEPNQPSKATRCEPEAKLRSEEAATKSPLELFREMFEMDSPLAAIDKQLDGFRRQGSFFESVFGSFKSFESTKEEPVAESSTQEEWREQRSREQRSRGQATRTSSMNERDKRVAFIQEEYQKGDLNEDEYKELIGLFSVP